MAERARETFLGLDIGTSSVKALLVDVEQRVVAEASTPLSVSRPHPLWSEQDPSDWVEGVEAAVAAIRRHAPSEFAALSGVGLSGQMHGATLLDAQNKPLRPAILWNDGRSFAECDELKRRVPDLEQRTGNLAMPGFTAPKMLWVAAHEPEIAKATRRVLLPKDYVRLRLSGEAVSEMSDASGTLWLDVGRRRWDAKPACGDWPDREGNAQPGRGIGSFGSSRAGNRRRLGPRGPYDSDCRRRRRQRRLRNRRRRNRARGGLRFARHLGRHFFGHRSLRQLARADAACVLPRVAASLARHGGDAVGRLLARLDRRRPGTRGRHRRVDRGGGFVRPIEGRGRLRADLPALSQRRAHAAQRRRGDRNVRRPTGRAWHCRARFRGHGGRCLLVRRRGRRSGRGRRAADPAVACWWRSAVGILGANDRRRHRLDDRSRFRRGSGRGAWRGEARHACRRRRKCRSGVRASG